MLDNKQRGAVSPCLYESFGADLINGIKMYRNLIGLSRGLQVIFFLRLYSDTMYILTSIPTYRRVSI